MPQSLRIGLIIRGVGATSSRLRGWTPEISQGSSLLATLGFIAESLWDSRSLASIKIRKVQRPRAQQCPRKSAHSGFQSLSTFYDGLNVTQH